MTDISDINLNRLAVFVAIVETGSMTAAAQRLGLTKTIVSTHLQKLEQEITTHLVVRTTRRLHLTEIGTEFFHACKKILIDTESAIVAARSHTQQMRGRLRIASATDYAAKVLAPLAAKLCLQHPELKIEILSSDQKQDIVAEAIDLTIRIGRLTDSSHKATLISRFEEWLVAPPHFFTNDLPKKPKELNGVSLVALSALPNPQVWTFTHKNGKSETIRFASSIQANNSSSVRAAVMAGGGVMVQPDFTVADDVAAGRLIRLLPNWSLPGGGIYAVFPASVQKSQKISVVIDALKSGF